MTDRTIEQLKAAETNAASGTTPEVPAAVPADRIAVERDDAARLNESLRKEAARSGLTAAETNTLPIDEIIGRIVQAEQDGTKDPVISVETPEQRVLLNRVVFGLNGLAASDSKRRLTVAARDELFILGGKYANACALLVAMRAMGRFAGEADRDAAVADLRALKSKAYARAWAKVSPDAAPARSLIDAFALRQLGFAGAVEYTTAAAKFVHAGGLTPEESQTQLANAASTQMLFAICKAAQEEFGAGLFDGLRNRLPGLHKDGIKVFVEAFGAVWSNEDALAAAAHSAIDIIARATRDGSGVITAIKEADDFALNYLDKHRGAWVDKFSAADSWEDPSRGLSWNLDTELLNIAGQPWTMRDSFTSAIVFGVTGSGKTSTVGHSMLVPMLEAGYGGVFFCVKPVERPSLENIIRKSGRGDDLIIISLKEESEYLGNNVLAQMVAKYEARGEIIPVEQVVQVLMTIIEAAGTNAAESKGSNAIFFDTMKTLLRGVVNLINLAGEDLTILNISRVMQSRAEGKVTRKWEEESYQAYLFRRAEWRMKNRPAFRRNLNVQMVWDETQRYWKEEIPKFDKPEAKTGNFMQSCIGEFTSMADVIAKNPQLQRLFCGRSDYSAADAHERGSLIILDIAIQDQEFGGMVGKIAAGIMLADTMRAALTRKGDTDKDADMRPGLIYCDEAQNAIIVKPLASFLAVSRSSRYSVLAITQGVTSIAEVFSASPGGKEIVASILQNIATWITAQTPDSATRELFAAACGQYKQRLRSNSGVSRSRQLLPSSLDLAGVASLVGGESRQAVNSWSESLQNYLQPQHFEALLPAPGNNWRAQTIVRTGKRFPDAPYKIVPEEGQVIEPQNFQFVEWAKPILLEDRLKAAEAAPPPVPAALTPPERKRGLFSRLFGGGGDAPEATAATKPEKFDRTLGGMFN